MNEGLMEVGWVLVQSADNEYGKSALPYMGDELLDLPLGRHPLYVARVQGGVDWMGLALDLEAQARRVESQTAERAMLAAAHGLRLMGEAHAKGPTE